MPTFLASLSLEQLPFPVSLEFLLIVGRAAALVGALCLFAFAFSRWRRAHSRDTQRIFEQLDLIQAELHGLAEGVTDLATRLDELAGTAAGAPERVQPRVGSVQRSYDNAIRLAQGGADRDEIVAQCGLVRHEADLVVRLHGRKSQERVAA